jgi:hypothetical protein
MTDNINRGSLEGRQTGVSAEGVVPRQNQQALNPTLEDAYWRENYIRRPYVKADRSYEYYQPAYRYGWESRLTNAGKSWEEMEPHLARGWEDNLASSQIAWHEARLAVRDAWNRIGLAHPGESNRARGS